MDDFLWPLGSFVVSHDIVFDWYAMLRGVFIEQRFFYERWPSVLFGGLVAANFMVNIVVCYSWIRSFNVRSLNSCKCCKVDFVSLLAVEGNCLAVSRVINKDDSTRSLSPGIENISIRPVFSKLPSKQPIVAQNPPCNTLATVQTSKLGCIGVTTEFQFAFRRKITWKYIFKATNSRRLIWFSVC